MKKTITQLLFLLALMVIGTSAYSQKTVTGTVTDAGTGEAIIGGNILVKGTTLGTITDIDGNYSLSVPSENSTLVFSYTGYGDKEMKVGTNSKIDVAMSQGQFLDEVVVTGYGSQKEKEITSAVVRITEKEFNKGPISDPTQLLQGKVAGLQIYNRGGDPNSPSTIRLRGLSTVGANVQPLIVIDGIIGANLSNVDPADIATMDVLKDGSAAAIYGSRGSSGVIIVTTKKGIKGSKVEMSYNGQYGGSGRTRTIKNMTASEFVAAGGVNLGSQTNFLDSVTQTGTNMVHNLAASGSIGNSTFRVSGNARSTDGILKNSGFDAYNARLNFSTKAFNDKVTLDFNTSYTSRNQQFGFDDALRYAITYNPTAPVDGSKSPFEYNEQQFGGYFETLGLFDSFNPVSIVNQNRNTGKANEFNYGASLGYNVTNNLNLNVRLSQQNTSNANRQYYPTTSLFRGNAASPLRKGQANFQNNFSDFKLLESFATYLNEVGNTNFSVTGGYSFQQNNANGFNFGLGDFPDNSKDFSNNIGVSQDFQNAGFINANSYASPDTRIIAFFGRANATVNDAIFLNGSLRYEGSSRLGAGNKWGLFPAFGAGVDLNKYLGLESVNALKLRLGYGVTGALPGSDGASQTGRGINNGSNGSVTTFLTRAANDSLSWERKAETNLGVEFATNRMRATLDVYNRTISDFILLNQIDISLAGVGQRFENAGKLNTKGVELALSYDLVRGSSFSYSPGIVLSSYKTILQDFTSTEQVRASLGAPGQNGTNVIRIKEGQEIGQIWGPVFDGVGDKGVPKFKDINNDGVIIADQGKALDPLADFQVLGNGVPDLELGFTNEILVGGFTINAFFRGAFGHSLVNSFRAFYEPRIASQGSYNFMNTKLAVPELKTAQFSSLYVEKADFFKLDNLTVSRRINLSNTAAIRNLNISLTGQNLFVITGYTGADPEPSLVDRGSQDNGGFANNNDVLSPGIDRRNTFFAPRTVTLGINFNF
jgi:iron complex outermembrane receptor protein